MVAVDKPPTTNIRWMIRRDLPEVLRIEAGSFPAPWNKAEFIEVLQQRNQIGMVCEIEKPKGEWSVGGFMIYALYKRHIDLLNFAVHPEYRRRGIGHAMVEKLASKLSVKRRNRISLVVRETNEAALYFFKSCGFLVADIVRDYYDDVDDDAYEMNYQLANPENRIAHALGAFH